MTPHNNIVYNISLHTYYLHFQNMHDFNYIHVHMYIYKYMHTYYYMLTGINLKINFYKMERRSKSIILFGMFVLVKAPLIVAVNYSQTEHRQQGV